MVTDARSVPMLAGMQLERHCTTSNTKRVEKLTTLQGRPHNLHKCRRGQRPLPLPPGALLPLTRRTPSRLPGLFDAVQPLDNARVPLDGGDAVGHPVIGTVIVPEVTVTVLRLLAVRADHAGAAEVERDDVRVGARSSPCPGSPAPLDPVRSS